MHRVLTADSVSAQEVFDYVAEHLLSMRERSMHLNEDDDLGCAYRGNGGAKCAVGACIRDDEYDPEMEGLAAEHIHLPLRLEPHHNLLEQLQRVHDPFNHWSVGGLNTRGVHSLRSKAQGMGLSTDRLDALLAARSAT